jgi:hypothetical protein
VFFCCYSRGRGWGASTVLRWVMPAAKMCATIACCIADLHAAVSLSHSTQLRWFVLRAHLMFALRHSSLACCIRTCYAALRNSAYCAVQVHVCVCGCGMSGSEGAVQPTGLKNGLCSVLISSRMRLSNSAVLRLVLACFFQTRLEFVCGPALPKLSCTVKR